MITVGDLITQLQQYDATRVVIMQKDGQGNGYRPLASIDDNALYEAEATWRGAVGLERLTDELIARGYTQEDVGVGVRCVVLYPVN